MLGEGRVVGQHLGRVFIKVQAVCRAFQHKAARAVGDHPVQLGKGQLVAEGNADKVQVLQGLARLLQIGAGAQKPGDQLKGGDVGFAGHGGKKGGVAHKVQPCNA